MIKRINSMIKKNIAILNTSLMIANIFYASSESSEKTIEKTIKEASINTQPSAIVQPVTPTPESNHLTTSSNPAPTPPSPSTPTVSPTPHANAHQNFYPYHKTADGKTVSSIVDYKDYTDDIASAQDFDEKNHRKNTINLVEKGIQYFNNHSLEDACNKFSHSKDFVHGELYLSLVKTDGVEFAHGENVDLLWQNVYDMHDNLGTPIFQHIINKAKAGGGWVTYEWRNSTKLTYTQEVKKDGQSYALSAGYYPHSKKDAVVSLVSSAVYFFNETLRQGKSVDDAFSPLSYPIGRFTFGDLYLYALDFKGITVAHGERPGLIGSNGWTYKDSNGKLVNQEIINMLKKTDEGDGVWVEYVSKRAKKRAYAQKVKDQNGNFYFIACGYYPDSTRTELVNLVKRGYQYMKLQGKTRASQEFSSRQSDEFRRGDLYLMVFDAKGNVLADGSNPDNVGINIYNNKDNEDRMYIQDIIERAKNGNGWTTIKMKNAYFSAYYEAIDIGLERYYIGASLFPVSKKDTMVLMVNGAADFLLSNEPYTAFNEFTKSKGKFIRGDLSLFVFDTNGICYTYGDDKNLIWRNLMNVIDDNGKPFVQAIIKSVREGATFVKYQLNGAEKIAYVESVEKDGKTYIIGSSFYR